MLVPRPVPNMLADSGLEFGFIQDYISKPERDEYEATASLLFGGKWGKTDDMCEQEVIHGIYLPQPTT